MRLPDAVRAHAAQVAASARAVRIDGDRLRALTLDGPAPPPLDTGLEPGLAGPYLLVVDTVNFGSGWFPTLEKRLRPDGTPMSGALTVAAALADRFRAHGAWTPAELRGMRTEEVAATLGQRADHELMALYAQALRALGAFLGERFVHDLVREAGSAVRLAEAVAGGMAMWADPGFAKRAQLLAADLARAGVAAFGDVGALTIFADNLVPHVLRCERVLVYEPVLAAHVDAGRLLPFGPWEREIRASAVHACAALAPRLGLTEPELDHLLWHRGQRPEVKARPRHRCRNVFY